MLMKSLDPRVNRLNFPHWETPAQKTHLDQFTTFEVFVQQKEGKPFQHEGIVHAPNEDMAFLFAKEQFSRRYTCTGLWVVATENVKVSEMTEDTTSVYDALQGSPLKAGDLEKFEIFHLFKRGKQHQHVGPVEAQSYEEALHKAKEVYHTDKVVYNVWIIRSEDMLFSHEEDKVIWETLSDKQFREAIAYKAMDKIKKFKEEQAAKEA
jgi:ring-1,2-phenylacetyl-CoA epoxidase subunit PaaB